MPPVDRLEGECDHPLQALPIDELRQRSSTKWRKYPAGGPAALRRRDGLPAAPIRSPGRSRAPSRSATPGTRRRSPASVTRTRSSRSAASAGRSTRRVIRTTCDVMMGVVETAPAGDGAGRSGDRDAAGVPAVLRVRARGGRRRRARAARARRDAGWELDLVGIEAAFAGGARAILLCNPHNPTGTVHSRASLAALAELAAALRRDGGQRRDPRPARAARRRVHPVPQRLADGGATSATRSRARARRSTSPGSSAR